MEEFWEIAGLVPDVTELKEHIQHQQRMSQGTGNSFGVSTAMGLRSNADGDVPSAVELLA